MSRNCLTFELIPFRGLLSALMSPLILAVLMIWLPLASPNGLSPAFDAVAAPPTAVATDQGGTVGGGCVGPGCGGPDFNQTLLGGNKGYPGLRARVNSRMFQYASGLVGDVLNTMIQRTRVPDIIQSTQPVVEGTVVLYNAYVSRYRCPQRAVLFPKPPSNVVLQVQNIDVGITGNLGGSILGSVPVTGIAQINIYGLTLALEISIEKGPRGPRANITSCAASVHFADMLIENGGDVGSIFNSYLKRSTSTMVQEMVADELCKMLPEQLDKQINDLAGAIPQAVAFKQFSALTGTGMSSSPSGPDPEFCAKQCGAKQPGTAAMGEAMETAPVEPQIPQAGNSSVEPKVVAVRSALPPLCSQCTSSAEDPTAYLRDFVQNLDLAKLNDVFVSVQLMNIYATSNDIAADVTGEFSPLGQGGTPFGAFPTMFPTAYDNHMVEGILSDYTINTALYWMHKKDFFFFRFGPESPKIGELLKTTCAKEEDTDEEEGSGADEVQLDEEETRVRRVKRRHLQDLLISGHKRQTVKERVRRQGALGGDAPLGGDSLSDLGLCFGDILPSVREKYPNKKIYIQVHTIRAPSFFHSKKKGGTASVNVWADADIYIVEDNIKVGTVTFIADVDVSSQLRGNKLYGMGEFTSLKMADTSGSLGLPQDALDNLGTLAKDLITNVANEALTKGIPINISQPASIPFSIYNAKAVMLDHGLYVAGDITVAPALLGILGGAGSCHRN